MSQTATILSFRSHVHPEEVTPALRLRMAHNIGIDHLIWSGFLAVLTIIVLVGIVLIDTLETLSPRLLWHVGTVVTLGIWAELLCFFVYERRKLFVLHNPATTAVVVRETGREDHAINERRAMVRYLPKVGQHFDLILVDSPPVRAVTDAAIAANVANGVVFVVGAEMTSRHAAQTAIEQLEQARAKFIGAVLNRVDLQHNSYYYSQYYRREYSDYYQKGAASQPTSG